MRFFTDKMPRPPPPHPSLLHRLRLSIHRGDHPSDIGRKTDRTAPNNLSVPTSNFTSRDRRSSMIVSSTYACCVIHVQQKSVTVTPSGNRKSVTVREWLILCHCNQLNFTKDWEIGKSEKCHCKQMALYCVTVTSVNVSNFSCTHENPTEIVLV